MSMEALGRLFDVVAGTAPYDTNSGAATGKRVSMRNCASLAVVVFKGAGSGTDDPVLTFRQHTAASGGTSALLATVDHYYRKSAVALTGGETWTRVAQAASSTLTLTGEAQKQGIYVVELHGTSLADGYAYISVDTADSGAAGAQLGGVLYLPHDLIVQRTPANLASPQA